MRTSPDHSSKPGGHSVCGVVLMSRYPQRGGHCTVPTVWSSLHGAQCGAHYTVPTMWCSLYGAHSMVLTVRCPQHGAHCTVLTNHTLIHRSSAQTRPGASPRILDPGFICSLTSILASSLISPHCSPDNLEKPLELSQN